MRQNDTSGKHLRRRVSASVEWAGCPSRSLLETGLYLGGRERPRKTARNSKTEESAGSEPPKSRRAGNPTAGSGTYGRPTATLVGIPAVKDTTQSELIVPLAGVERAKRAISGGQFYSAPSMIVVPGVAIGCRVGLGLGDASSAGKERHGWVKTCAVVF